jgi:CRISPR/Cas system-associated exonuclease Cas4 (RecB family)
MTQSIKTQATQLFTLSFERAVEESGEHLLKTTGRKSKQWPNARDKSYYLSEGPLWVQSYVDFRRKNYDYQILKINDRPAIEISFQVKIPGHPAELRGFIDRVFVNPAGEILICDLKTGSSPQISSLQLATYAYGLSKQYGIEATKGVYYSAPDGKFSDTFDLAQFPHDYVERIVREAYDRVQADHLMPVPAFRCNFCGVKDACYIFNPTIPRPDFRSDIDNPWDDIIEPYDLMGER